MSADCGPSSISWRTTEEAEIPTVTALKESSFSSHSYLHLLLFVFLVIALPVGLRWNLSTVLIYISLLYNGI